VVSDDLSLVLPGRERGLDLIGSPVEADYSTVDVRRDEDESLLDDPGALAREVAKLESAMREAAEALEFEQAAGFRDRIRYLRERAALA
jgi:excinuclease ABC subunit B